VTRNLRSEWLKLRTTRVLLWIGLVDAALVCITAISVAASSGSIDTPADDRSIAQIAGAAAVFALVLGIVVMAGESTHGTITQTLLVTPVRERVLAAKIVVAALVAVALVLLSEALVLIITVPGAGLSVHNARSTLLGVLLAGPLAAVLGVGPGAIARGQGGAISFSLLWLLIGENLMPVINEEAARYAPGRTFAALASGSREGTDVVLGMGAGGLVSLAWAGLFVAAGLFILLGRDV
jgi:ABC-2 type transport system permease protein